MKNLLRVAHQAGWREAIEKVIRPVPHLGPKLASYATNESRGDLFYVLDIHPGDKVLELGCGLGPITAALAQKPVRCFAVDGVLENAAFTLCRCRQMGIVDVQAASFCVQSRLPVPHGYFDTVIISNVTERVGFGLCHDNDGLSSCLAVLEEVSRVVRRGGQVYLAIEDQPYGNTASWPHKTTQDTSVLMGNTGILQKPVARLLGAWKRVGYTRHWMSFYRSLAATAGLKERAVYGIMPSHGEPSRFVPLSQTSLGRLRMKEGNAKTVVGNNGPIHRRRLPGLAANGTCSYAFVLEKG